MIILASFNLHPQKWTYGFKKIPSNKPRIETILPGQAHENSKRKAELLMLLFLG